MQEATDGEDIAAALDLPAIKLHCSVLAEKSIKQALNDWKNKLQEKYYGLV